MPTSTPLPKTTVRLATTGDFDRIHDLAVQLHHEVEHSGADESLRGLSRDIFMQSLRSDACRTLVVHPIGEPGGLVACGTAWIHQVTPALWLPSGKMGYLQGFYTVPSWRGREISRDIAEQLLAWLTEAGCTQAHLHAVAAAAPLYQRLGFVPARNSNLWLRLPRDETAAS